MLIAWTGSYFLALLIWGLDQISLPGSLDIVWCLLPAASLFLLFKGFCLVSPQSLPVPMEHRPSVPWKLIVVLSAFALAFGLGDAVTGQNMFTWVSKVGMGIPELLVLLSVVFLYRQFSFRHLVTVAAPLVVAGLVGAFFVGQQAIPSFILMNAGSETYLILVYAVACITARKLGTSAVYLGGLFAGFYKVFLQVGKGAGLTVIGQVHDVALSTPILALAMVTMTIVASIALVQDRSIVDKFSWKEQSAQRRLRSPDRAVPPHAAGGVGAPSPHQEAGYGSHCRRALPRAEYGSRAHQQYLQKTRCALAPRTARTHRLTSRTWPQKKPGPCGPGKARNNATALYLPRSDRIVSAAMIPNVEAIVRPLPTWFPKHP